MLHPPFSVQGQVTRLITTRPNVPYKAMPFNDLAEFHVLWHQRALGISDVANDVRNPPGFPCGHERKKIIIAIIMLYFNY
jgi:hypothetical protein